MVRKTVRPELVRQAFTETFLDRSQGAFARTPFKEPIGRWGEWVTFASDVPFLATDATVAEDAAALAAVGFGNTAYGAATYPLRPFAVAFEGGATPTGAEVLAALKVRAFGSEHIRRLDTAKLPYPGYHAGTRNDEIHTDPCGQALFTRPDHERVYSEEVSDEALASRRALAALQKEVAGPLYFVLLHEEDGEACPLVVLFAVGKSKRGSRLIGVASQQVCHNLCD